MDDGSKDNCPRIIDEYAKKDNRIIVIHKENGGYGNACNAGFSHVRGEYIAILEPDDFIDLNMYEELYKKAKENDCDIVKSSFYIYYDINGKKPKNEKQIWYSEENNWKIPDSVFTINDHPEFFSFHPSVWSCIYSRYFFEKHKIKMEEIPGAGWADNLFQIQTFCFADRISYIDNAFYHWRMIYRDDAKNLNDSTIPFLRTRTIHKWLRDNDIINENIWACLYKREIEYMNIVFRTIKFKQLPSLKPLFMEMVNDINPAIVKRNIYIKPSECRVYYQFYHYYYYYYCYLFKRVIYRKWDLIKKCGKIIIFMDKVK